jgi:hypothetical protein
VGGVDPLDHDARNLDPAAHVKLGGLLRAGTPRHGGASTRDDRRAVSVETAQGAVVQVVAVRMGDEDRVKRQEIVESRSRRPAADVEDAAQERIGDQAAAGKLDEHGRMADVGERARAFRHYSERGRGLSDGRRPGLLLQETPPAHEHVVNSRRTDDRL